VIWTVAAYASKPPGDHSELAAVSFHDEAEARHHFGDLVRKGLPPDCAWLDLYLQSLEPGGLGGVTVLRNVYFGRKADGSVTRLETPGITPTS